MRTSAACWNDGLQMKSLLIWDLDGTLVDSRTDIANAANQALTAIGRPAMPHAIITGFIGDGIGILIERLTPGGDEPERARCRTAFEAAYAANCCTATAPYPGIHETLTALRAAGWMQAIATNKALAYTTPILAHCGLAGFFAAVRGGDGRRKPDPWQLQDLARELDADLSRSWMIGDHHTDIHAAHAAGCRVLFCRWGLGQRDGLPVDAEAVAPATVPQLIATFPGV